MATPRGAVVFDAHLGGYPGDPARDRVRPLPRNGFAARRRPDAVDGGHAVPAVVEEGGPRHQRGQRQPAAGGARQPLGLRRLAGVAAQAAARVRRRDRPRGRQLRRPDRLVRRLPLPRRRVRGLLGGAERQHGGDRRRGLVRLGDRRCAGGGDRVRPRRQRTDRVRSAGGRARGGVGRRGRATSRAAAGRAGRARETVRTESSARWRPSSTASTPSSARSGSVRSTRSSRPLVSGRTSSRLSSGACDASWSPASSEPTAATEGPEPVDFRAWRC